MKASVAGKPYVIVMELVLAVLALVIIWHVFSKFFGFGAGILQGFVGKITCEVGKHTTLAIGAWVGGNEGWAAGLNFCKAGGPLAYICAIAGAIGGGIAGIFGYHPWAPC